MRAYTTQIVTTVDKNLTSEWKVLWKKSKDAHYFNSYDWFATCQAVFPRETYFVVVVRKHGELEALIPLVKKSFFGIQVYTNPGGKYVDRSALLIADHNQNTAKRLLAALSELGFWYLPEVTEEIVEAIRHCGDISISFSGPNYQLPFEENVFRFVKNKNIRNIEKILDECGKSLEFCMYRGDLDQLQKAMEIDLVSYRDKKNIGTFRNSIDKIFFKKLAEHNSKNIGINILYYNSQPIAYEIGIRSKKVYHGLNKSFDSKYKEFTPGKVVTYLLLKGLLQEKIRVFDFSRGDDMLKRSFTQIKKAQYDVVSKKPLVQASYFRSIRSLRSSLLRNNTFYNTYRRFVYMLI